MQTFRSHFGTLVFDCSTCDRAGSNLRAEAALQFFDTPGHARLRLSCHVHQLSTVQGRAFDIVPDAISGCIAVALTMKRGSAVEDCRQALVAVLLESVQVVEGGAPYLVGSPQHIYRKAVFDLLLDVSVSGRKRRCTLEACLNGDLSDETILWFAPAGKGDPQKWARDTACALLPSAIKLFPRNRWVLSMGCVAELALLSVCHNLFSRAVAKWLGSPVTSLAGGTGDDYDAASGGNLDSIVEHLPPGLTPTDFWSKFNDRQRNDTVKFAQSQPLPLLLLMRISLEPQSKLMQRLLDLSSDGWEERQEQLAMEGKERKIRMAEAYHGRITAPFCSQVRTLLDSDLQWAALPCSARTGQHKSLAFALLCRAAGGIHFHMEVAHQGYPWKLWGLLNETCRDSVANEILKDPRCLMCEFTFAFIGKFSSKIALMSQASLALLVGLGITLRLDIARVECRHAWVRRMWHVKSQTNTVELSRVSADFVLMRARASWVTHWAQPATPVVKHEKGQQCEGRKRAAPHGGAQRAHFHKRMKQGCTDFPALHKEYNDIKAAGGQEYQDLLRLGRAALTAGRAGNKRPFGLRRGNPAVSAQDVREAFGLPDQQLPRSVAASVPDALVIKDAAALSQNAVDLQRLAIHRDGRAQAGQLRAQESERQAALQGWAAGQEFAIKLALIYRMYRFKLNHFVVLGPTCLFFLFLNIPQAFWQGCVICGASYVCSQRIQANLDVACLVCGFPSPTRRCALGPLCVMLVRKSLCQIGVLWGCRYVRRAPPNALKVNVDATGHVRLDMCSFVVSHVCMNRMCVKCQACNYDLGCASGHRYSYVSSRWHK